MQPNFIIAGAAKSGTTSLYRYLCQHPDVFMPEQKEPHYFVADEPFNFPIVAKQAEYDALFEGTTAAAVGEASTGYLYFPKAARRIKAALPNTKIIVIARNPVDRAFSMWGHQVREGLEQQSFTQAVNEELDGQQRQQSGVEYGFNYCKLGFVADQIKQYQTLFGKDNVLVGDYQHLKNNPACFMQMVFEFLGVDSTFQGDYSGKFNPSGKPKFAGLHHCLNSTGWLRKALVAPAKLILPSRYRHQLWRTLREWNIRSGQRHAMPQAMREKLESYFRFELRKLEKLITN